nr:DUF2161 family putative PD-(D/E)XK-type phosphodiesterase [Cohnella lubricantis]
MYPPIKQYFASRGYEVKGEVRGCDLMAVHPDIESPIIVEIKKTFTLPLLLQGLDRQRTGAAVWLAVERNRTKKGAHNQRFHELSALCGRLALGFMTVTFYKTKEPVIEVWREPEEAMNAAGGRKRAGAKRLLREFDGRSGDYNVGGSLRRKLVTAYRERTIQCALALACHGQLSPSQVRDLTSIPGAAGILRGNPYGWFRNVKRGVYELTPQGRDGLREFEEVTAVWAAKLEWAAGWEDACQASGGPSAY